MSVAKLVGGVMTFLALILSVVSSYLLYNLVNATPLMWCIFAVNIVLLSFGAILTALGGD